uniref:PB1 domain-containing protein n=1 Tax=Stegastes partitus TaxID=144197 RepID=A0A3B4Z567_9TELE
MTSLRLFSCSLTRDLGGNTSDVIRREQSHRRLERPTRFLWSNFPLNMSTLQTLKTFIHQRLAVAVDEIFGLLETTISDYEEEISRQRRLMEDERSEFLSKKADLQQAMRFRVIIEHDIKKITFQNGLPSSVEDLIKVFKQAFSITTDIGLQYKDADFDDFFTLTSTSDLKDKDTLKVVRMPPGIIMTTVSHEHHPDTSDVSSVDDLLSVDSQDNLLPSPPATERQNLWPALFPIPTFSYNTEMALRQGNEKFLKDGTPLTTPSVKSDILERLAETMFSYTAYPNDPQRAAVAQALIEKHPCLREPGSFNGCYGWQQSLKYKCANYRSKLKAHGNPELIINTLKHKQEGDRKPAKNIKKPRKSEVNYLPSHPAGETDSSLENVRLELIAASKMQDNGPLINDMMSRTYSCRRREVVGQAVQIAEFKERWPALFDPVQVHTAAERSFCSTTPCSAVRPDLELQSG